MAGCNGRQKQRLNRDGCSLGSRGYDAGCHFEPWIVVSGTLEWSVRKKEGLYHTIPYITHTQYGVIVYGVISFSRKEAYVQQKRGLRMQQKRPTYTTKEAYMYGKKAG